jgi:uncharacterized protein HemX
MKKLLAVATIGVVGYVVVKKLRERKNNEVEVNEEVETTETEVVENVEEEITIDNDEETIREEIIDEIINSVNNIKENYDAIEEIQKVCEEIFNTNTKEFDDLFKDLKL